VIEAGVPTFPNVKVMLFAVWWLDPLKKTI